MRKKNNLLEGINLEQIQDLGWKVVCFDQVVLETRWVKVRYTLILSSVHHRAVRQSAARLHLQLLAVYLVFCLTVGKWLTVLEIRFQILKTSHLNLFLLVEDQSASFEEKEAVQPELPSVPVLILHKI